jgi:chloramphenicol 3-O phosphotransferase
VAPGTIVVLNGTPRSGKSSIAAALQSSSDVLWLTFGVDAMAAVTPARLRPGIGLRPGGERPDLEDGVVVLFDALYSAVAAWSRAGRCVVVDVGHHDDYTKPLGILTRTASALLELPAYFVGVRCPVEVIMSRRDADAQGGYVTSEPDGSIPDVVYR